MKRQLILGSSSKPRKLLLERLQIPFQVASPDVDETPLPAEPPSDMVLRLAEIKARKIAEQFPTALIIGADQVGVLQDEILGKPLTIEKAKQQLQKMSGQHIQFLIGLCLYDANNQTQQLSLETFDVKFRHLTPELINHYIQKDLPLQCAGSFRAEGLGITLVDKFQGDDFTALIGLPLIRLTRMLEQAGMGPLDI